MDISHRLAFAPLRTCRPLPFTLLGLPKATEEKDSISLQNCGAVTVVRKKESS